MEFKCKSCNFIFTKIDEIIRHCDIHGDFFPAICGINTCNKKFNSKKLMQKHIFRSHQEIFVDGLDFVHLHRNAFFEKLQIRDQSPSPERIDLDPPLFELENDQIDYYDQFDQVEKNL